MLAIFVAFGFMSNSKSKPRIEAASEAKTGRRHWPDADKLRIVQESLRDGVVQAQLARRHGVSPSQLYDWRYRYKAGLLVGAPEFSQVVVVADEAQSTADQVSSTATQPDLVVEVGQRYRLTIPAGFDMDAAARLLRGWHDCVSGGCKGLDCRWRHGHAAGNEHSGAALEELKS